MSATASVTRAVPRLRPLAERLLVPRLLLPLVFAGSAFWLAWQAGHVNSFIWMIDEGLYAKEAQAYADLQGLLPHVQGQRHGVPNVLYPMLVAPFYALLSGPDAFTAAHILNGVVWASTLFPVYLLARRVGAAWPWALLAGTLAVWVPWAVAVTVLMTEAVAYAAFAWALYAMTVAVASPRPRNDALALLAIVVSISARTQFVFLLGAFVLAIVVYALALREPGRAWWRSLRSHWVVGALFGAGALVVLAISLADSQFLGGYSAVTGLPLFPGGLWGAAGLHLGHVVVGVGIVPAILFGAWLLGLASTPPARGGPLAFAVVGSVTLALLIYQAAFFMQNVGAVLQERYVSYAAPILFVGMAAFAAQRHRVAPRIGILVAGVIAAAAVAGAPHSEAEASNAFDTVGNGSAAYIFRLGPWVVDLTRPLPGRDLSTGEALVVIALALAVITAVAFGIRWRRFAVPALCLLALAFTFDATRSVVPRAVLGIDSGFPHSLAGVREIPRDWIDRATPDDALVGLHVGTLDVPDEQNQWLWTTFWNEKVQRSYAFNGTMAHSVWPANRWTLDRRTGRLATDEPPDYLVASQVDPVLAIHGRVVAHSTYNAVVVQPARPLRAKWSLEQSREDTGPLRLYLYPERPGVAAPAVELTLGVGAAPPEEGKVEVPYGVDDGTRKQRGVLAAGEERKIVVRPPVSADGAPTIVTIVQQRRPLSQGKASVHVSAVTELPA
ncbi:MAG TPA: hypothetical protein VF529_14935 [Solirubrobacteraceae bacterium]